MQGTEIQEKVIKPRNGWAFLALVIALLAAAVVCFVCSANGMTLLLPAAIVLLIAFLLVLKGLNVIRPNEAAVFLFFGKYYGTLRAEGFYWVNPFCTRGKKLSLKAMTLNNDKQKVNDADGNPIEIGVIVIWRIIDTARASFSVDNYAAFISTQCDSAIRQVARQYPYDVSDDGDEKSLRGSSQEIADVLKSELQSRVEMAGIEIMESRIAHLAYAPEIAAAMLQRQQAAAIIVARQKIVEGAVGMVEMALTKLNDNGVVQLDEERKAQMVSNLLVVLCGNKDAQPIVNSGTIY